MQAFGETFKCEIFSEFRSLIVATCMDVGPVVSKGPGTKSG